MPNQETTQKRWWQLKRARFVALPTMLVIGIVVVFVWGSLQPRPVGYALVDGPQIVATAAGASAIVEKPATEPLEIVRYTLDATSRDEWVLFDFNEGRVIEGDLSSPLWDLAFRRTKLLTNSGATNSSGKGGAVDLGDVPLEDVILPSSVTYTVDVLGGEDEDELENHAIGTWYSYSFIKHIVSTGPNSYMVATGEDLNAVVQFDSYYCEDEEPGCITFRYRLVPRTGTAES